MVRASIKLEAPCDSETERRLVERTARAVSDCLGLPIHDVIVASSSLSPSRDRDRSGRAGARGLAPDMGAFELDDATFRRVAAFGKVGEQRAMSETGRLP